MQAAEDPSVKAEALKTEPWALEDLRTIQSEELFLRLKKHSIELDKTSFVQFAESCDTPEDLAELLLPEEEEDLFDPLYLLVFELWRRFVPEKQSLSIFGDEFDFLIAQYDQEKLESDEPIQDALANLIEILEENADAGVPPKEVFSAISDYCAHDLESFLVDYISEILDSDNEAYALELIEGFSPYISEPIWFDFLRARAISSKDGREANEILRSLLEQKETDPALLREILQFLASDGDHTLFVSTMKKILPLLKTQEELLDLMEIAADYYHRLDQESVEQTIQKLLQKRKCAEGPLSPSDPDLKTLHQLLLK
jgi:hypothetical protein